MKKIAICYFTNQGEIEYLNESLKALQRTID